MPRKGWVHIGRIKYPGEIPDRSRAHLYCNRGERDQAKRYLVEHAVYRTYAGWWFLYHLPVYCWRMSRGELLTHDNRFRWNDWDWLDGNESDPCPGQLASMACGKDPRERGYATMLLHSARRLGEVRNSEFSPEEMAKYLLKHTGEPL